MLFNVFLNTPDPEFSRVWQHGSFPYTIQIAVTRQALTARRVIRADVWM